MDVLVFDLVMSLPCLDVEMELPLDSLIFVVGSLDLEDGKVLDKLDEVSEPLFCLMLSLLLLLCASLDEVLAATVFAWCRFIACRRELN